VRQLKPREVPIVKAAVLKQQDGKCPLCTIPLTVQTGCLDHDHVTGVVRGVLCRNCNGIEGKIKNLVTRARRGARFVDWLGRLIMYWLHHERNPRDFLYPTHRNDEQKRVLRNMKARKRRASKKGKTE
jgi:hypothetical protein